MCLQFIPLPSPIPCFPPIAPSCLYQSTICLLLRSLNLPFQICTKLERSSSDAFQILHQSSPLLAGASSSSSLQRQHASHALTRMRCAAKSRVCIYRYTYLSDTPTATRSHGRCSLGSHQWQCV